MIGRGTGGDYWFPAVAVVLTLLTPAFGWRRPSWPILAVITTHLLLFAGATWLAITIPNEFRFRGDTLAIDMSLAWLGPTLFGAGAAAAMADLRRSYRRGRVRVPAWSRHNQRWVLILVACLPIQFAYCDSGRKQLADQLGVLLTIAPWLLVGQVFRPYAMTDVQPNPYQPSPPGAIMGRRG